MTRLEMLSFPFLWHFSDILLSLANAPLSTLSWACATLNGDEYNNEMAHLLANELKLYE